MSSYNPSSVDPASTDNVITEEDVEQTARAAQGASGSDSLGETAGSATENQESKDTILEAFYTALIRFNRLTLERDDFTNEGREAVKSWMVNSRTDCNDLSSAIERVSKFDLISSELVDTYGIHSAKTGCVSSLRKLQSNHSAVTESKVKKLQRYVEDRFKTITESSFRSESFSNSLSSEDRSKQKKLAKATESFRKELISQIDELAKEEQQLNLSTTVITGEQISPVGHSGEEKQRFDERIRSLNNYVKTVLPPHQSPEPARLDNLIAKPEVIRAANKNYIAQQPSLSKKQKALRLAGFALAFGIAAVAIAAGITLCVASAGLATPVVAAVAAPVIAAVGGTSAALVAGNSISLLGGVIGFFAFVSKGHLKTKEQEKAKELSDDALCVSNVAARIGGG